MTNRSTPPLQPRPSAPPPRYAAGEYDPWDATPPTPDEQEALRRQDAAWERWARRVKARLLEKQGRSSPKCVVAAAP